MARREQGPVTDWVSNLGAAALALAIVFGLTLVASQPSQAQTYKVIYTFTGGQDGAVPLAGLTIDKGGNLYGTAAAGGYMGGKCSASGGCGTVFQLKHQGSGWTFNPLYSFHGSDGWNPLAGVIFGPDGTLYGATSEGGTYGWGTVFNVRPFPSVCKTVLCPWTETVLYAFEGYPTDGAGPAYGDLAFDQAGNIYGTTYGGGSSGYGTVYELTHSGSGWTEEVLYAFALHDGYEPANGVIFDNAGNLYGTTELDFGNFYGTVYELTPSGSGWTESVLYNFPNGNNGSFLYAGLIFDQSGNLYGAASAGGAYGGGTIFELTPAGNNNWTFTLLYSFAGNGYCGPWATLAMDGAGSLYGTTRCDGANQLGNVFKLTPSNGGWTYTSLHDFTRSDGGYPYSNVVFDANGNLYGTNSQGGEFGCSGGSATCGLVWEISFP